MSNPSQNLWAPWRMEYIDRLGDRNRPDGCFLCDYWADPAADARNLVLWRTAECMVLLNRFPYSNGHLLIAPAVHVASLEQLESSQMAEMMALARDAQTLLSRTVGAEGFNLGANFGRCAGAGLPDHLHLHLVPRWSGDTNYMAVVGDVRVIPQALDASYAQLRAAAEQMSLPREAGRPHG